MKKYTILTNILDKIIQSKPERFSKLYSTETIEKTNQSRSRAFIHLYLKVGFGLLSFEEREKYITDGSYDSGIDGYFIDKESRTIYFIQSKFRTNEDNFESKKIELDEILVMDINEILDGNTKDDKGNDYNGKIKQLQREVSEIENIGRYRYEVILLANIEENIPNSKFRQLTGGYPVTAFDYEKCYNDLVFPVITGTFFSATELNISLDLSNKNAGSKISYTVTTKNGECEITVLFVPTIEIAKVLLKYKNSVLKYNPRSYLEFAGKKVNTAIRETIINESTNEFALFNNGITMLSDDSSINERIGQKNKAQLSVRNPQIINGGQTAYTLSRLLEENQDNLDIFQNKEVLLKVITFLDSPENFEEKQSKIELIDRVSNATNQQTPVLNADKFANDIVYKNLQKTLFERYGLLLERKRGEFEDGIINGYIDRDELIERNLFFRIYYAVKGEINKASSKRLFQSFDTSLNSLDSIEDLDKFYFGYLMQLKIPLPSTNGRARREKSGFAKLYLMTKLFQPDSLEDYNNAISKNLNKINKIWDKHMDSFSQNTTKYHRTFYDKDAKVEVKRFVPGRWYSSESFEEDIKELVMNIK
ncbi:MAG: AIPR family protein [Vicingaceae bacterium]|nr:AIPR family protein [Vicingaceae bacterium]